MVVLVELDNWLVVGREEGSGDISEFFLDNPKNNGTVSQEEEWVEEMGKRVQPTNVKF